MKTVRKLVVVGGGSSGWMTAAYLSRVLFDIHITLIESKVTPVIGVGEATVPFLNHFMNRLGFSDYRQWLAECDGTIKTGILFENWLEKGDSYWHPFEQLEYLDDRRHTGHAWVAWRHSGNPEFQTRRSFYDSFYASTRLNSVENRAPVMKEFAYHLNADLFGFLLRRSSPAVRHVQDDVVDVRLDATGAIASLITAENGEFTADLFIDCTGWRRILMRSVGAEQPFQSYSASLFCDRAVVLRFPYGPEATRGTEMNPYVKASARSAGWIWTIPLYSRISSGYVYSSSFLSDAAAEQELCAYWGETRTDGIAPHRIRFEAGKYRDLWVRNCVAVGLAGGFIEPLESTGLAITQMGIEMLASVLDARYFDDFIVLRYNAHLEKFCADILQFITSHYCFTRREDTPFWRAVKHETQIPDDLRARHEIFQRYLPSVATKGLSEAWMFRDISWFSVLLGMDFPFDPQDVPAELLLRAGEIRERKARIVREMSLKIPGHYEYLRENLYTQEAESVR